ncbi:aminopeptidase P family protein [Metamycoplasma equirhinis]|uniref:Aminopeptidase P family protein n=1 Tax=Metamycoplasma equirhinis TaxID=92402 RepID=A0ABZ0P9K0_9BACT|nr:aminopeptidase P family protein [Metamycoplasma equirhinis]TPD97797.1 aminopeptidase P family protein [Metamycoplasma equirhinis]WPB53693.1 aminopeptidase P family protein [Metamycoplasma equirhinis]BDX52702.1 Xaa-Pro dipeptidase [Metamycoplasma equirhinis]
MLRTELEKIFKENKLDAVISEAPQTRLWYAGIQTSDGFLVIENDKAHLFVDGRYIEYATKNAKNVEIHLLKGDSFKTFLTKKAYKKIGVEKDYLNLETFEYFKSILPKAEYVSIVAKKFRIIKDEEEFSKVEEACLISLQAFEELKKVLVEGMTELEASNKLGYLMRLFGAEKECFETIIAFGSNAAEPHHHPTNRKLVDGDIVKVDFGAQYKGWASDITRTFFFGKPKEKELVDILEIVTEAQRLGREAVKPGIDTNEIDKICRDYIESKGYGKFFTHSTGHGVGIDVHELPGVGRGKGDATLEAGMIITVEPGIYIEGLGGARVEDTVLVTKDGAKVLSRPEDYK